MDNQQAIIAGVHSWLDANKSIVMQTLHKAAEKAILEIAEIVGVQMSARAGRWYDEHTQEIVSAIALQLAFNEIESNPKIMARIIEEMDKKEALAKAEQEAKEKELEEIKKTAKDKEAKENEASDLEKGEGKSGTSKNVGVSDVPSE